MNNTFSIKRFGTYLLHDMRTAVADSGLSLLIIGAMPLFQYFIPQAFALVFKGSAFSMGDMGKAPAYITAFLLASIIFPTKHYGGLTDKKQGSDWLMLPASTLEKWFSMLLVTCVAVPAFLLAELAATDGLMSLCFSGTYGATAISGIVSAMQKVWAQMNIEGVGGIAITWPAAMWLSWCECVLFFTTGAIFFKKSKIGKTFLAAFVLGMLISLVTIAVMRAIGLNGIHIDTTDFNEMRFIRSMNVIVYMIYIVWFAVQDAVLYFRMKTLKH